MAAATVAAMLACVRSPLPIASSTRRAWSGEGNSASSVASGTPNSGEAGSAHSCSMNDSFAVGEVNQQALFGRVAAVVHHGGAGTTTTATRAGAPQVVVPQMADQPYFAGRVADLGIGAAHDGPTPTFESLSAALRTALTPRPGHERPPWPARSAPTGRRWPRRCCSTRSAGKSRQCPREPRGIVEPGKVPPTRHARTDRHARRRSATAARRRTHRRATTPASKIILFGVLIPLNVAK